MKYPCSITSLIAIIEKAGDIIASYYQQPREVALKSDNSPVTSADIAAHLHITKALSTLTPDIPIISEESSEEIHQQAHYFKRFWLIDPLDGTKAFIAKQEDFTVNIALIEDKTPVLGLIYAPITKMLYYTGEDGKAYKMSNKKHASIIHASYCNEKHPVTVITSRSLPNTDMENYLGTLTIDDMITLSSSIKFGMLAEGAAHIYPRFGRTMEWDTAAGHAIVHFAGGSVSCVDGSPLLYSKAELSNPNFIAKGRSYL